MINAPYDTFALEDSWGMLTNEQTDDFSWDFVSNNTREGLRFTEIHFKVLPETNAAMARCPIYIKCIQGLSNRQAGGNYGII